MKFFSACAAILATILMSVGGVAYGAKANTSPSAPPKQTPANADGLTITAEIDPFPATTDMATRLETLQTENQKLRSRMLKIQDEMASQFEDTIQVQIEAVAENDPAQKKPIGFVELAATLNNVELVRYVNPPMTTRNPRYPLFTGPLPSGVYQLKIRAVAGVLQHGWPYALLQGRWNVEKTFPIKVDSSMNGKVARLVLKTGDLSPNLSLAQVEEGPP